MGSFDFNKFINDMNKKIDGFQKQKDEKEMMRLELDKRQMDDQERNSSSQRALAANTFNMQKKMADTAADTEYYRKKQAFDVQAGNMNPDTYDMLYSGASANGVASGAGASSGLRSKGGASANGDPDYEKMLTEAFKADKESGELRTFGDYAADTLDGNLVDGKRDGKGLRSLFQQQQQVKTAGQIYDENKTKSQMDFDQNLTMSRDSAGKMRFAMGQQGADNKGWGSVSRNVQRTRTKDPRSSPFKGTAVETRNNINAMSQQSRSPISQQSTSFYSPPAARLQMGTQTKRKLYNDYTNFNSYQ